MKIVGQPRFLRAKVLNLFVNECAISFEIRTGMSSQSPPVRCF